MHRFCTGQFSFFCTSAVCGVCQVGYATGACVNAAAGSDPKSNCGGGVCNGSGSCLLALGQVCSGGASCASHFCSVEQSGFSICSAITCGLCQVINNTGTACVIATDGTDPKSQCPSGQTCQAGACQ